MGALTHAPTPIDHVHLQSSALPSGWDVIAVKRCWSIIQSLHCNENLSRFQPAITAGVNS